MTNSFAVKKVAPQTIRLKGTISVTVGEKTVPLSDTFTIQTGINFAGLSTNEQQLLLDAIEVSLSGNAEIAFTAQLVAEEVKSSKPTAAVSELSTLLSGFKGASTAERVEAIVRKDQEDATSISAARSILGASPATLTKNWGLK